MNCNEEVLNKGGRPSSMPPTKVFFLFLRLGALTFGGGIVMMGLLEKEMRNSGRFQPEEIIDMMVFTTAFPGPIAVNLALLAGVKMAGIRGAVAAVCGTILPPFLTILFLARLLILHIGHPIASSFFTGAGCAVVVIIGGVVYSMLKIAVSGGWKDVVVVLLTSSLLMGFSIHPFIAVAAGLSVRLLLGAGRPS